MTGEGWEAMAWSALALGAPTLQTWLADRAEAWGELAPWLFNLLPAYLALLRGAVSGRDLGVYGLGGASWAAGTLACGLALAATALVLHIHPVSFELPSPVKGALDEPRWALYRAAGVVWAGGFWQGAAIGLALAVVEWSLTYRVRGAEARSGPGGWAALMRRGLSTALFVVTRNLWLTTATQACLLAVARKRA